jgi:hypothetical protein
VSRSRVRPLDRLRPLGYFCRHKTYSWSKVEAVNSIWDARVKSAVDKELATQGWPQAPTGQDVTLVAVETTRTKQLSNTFLRRLRGLALGDSEMRPLQSRSTRWGIVRRKGEWRNSQVELCSAMIDSSLSFIFCCPAGIHSR